MKIATMLGDVWQSIWQRPITQKYPFERLEAPVRLRGKLHWNPEKCTGCALCNKDCPANAIEIITVDKKKTICDEISHGSLHILRSVCGKLPL